MKNVKVIRSAKVFLFNLRPHSQNCWFGKDHGSQTNIFENGVSGAGKVKNHCPKEKRYHNALGIFQSPNLSNRKGYK